MRRARANRTNSDLSSSLTLTLALFIFFVPKLSLPAKLALPSIFLFLSLQMFDFEKLDVYQKAKNFNVLVYNNIVSSKGIDAVPKNQLNRASLSIMLNIA